MLMALEPARLVKEMPMQRTGSILVVDNDAAIVDLVVEVLTDEGYVAYSALDGAGALASITCHAPALLLLDLHMPGMSDVKLIAQLRRADLATMPMVLLAAPLLVPGGSCAWPNRSTSPTCWPTLSATCSRSTLPSMSASRWAMNACSSSAGV
jgi:Response regulator receiver domain